MTRTVWLALVGVLAGCNTPVSTSPGGDASTGSLGTSTGELSPSSSSDASTTSSGPAETSTDTGGTDSSSSSTGTTTSQCEVEVVESFSVSGERFGELSVPGGDRSPLVLGALGWVLSGSIGTPAVERLIETEAPLLVGRFGPDGGTAFAQVDGQTVAVRSLDDPATAVESTVPNSGTWVVGDMDADGLDDLVVTSGGRIVVWRADGGGAFEELAASEDGQLAQLYGHAPATAWAPPAVLVSDDATGAGIVGFEVEDDALAKAYTVAVPLVWWAGGVQPSQKASREILYAAQGGVLIEPKDSQVGFVVGQDGEWLRRRYRFAAGSATEPRALDLDRDGTLDAVFATADADRLVGACTDGDFDLVPCLDVALEGRPESIAVDGNGDVFVATEDAGLWVYRRGPCE